MILNGLSTRGSGEEYGSEIEEIVESALITRHTHTLNIRVYVLKCGI